MSAEPESNPQTEWPSEWYVIQYKRYRTDVIKLCKSRGALEPEFATSIAYTKAVKAYERHLNHRVLPADELAGVSGFVGLWKHIAICEMKDAYKKAIADREREQMYAGLLDLTSSPMDPYSSLAKAEIVALARELLSRIPAKDRLLIECIYVENLGYRELQERDEFKDDSLEALRVRALRARKTMRDINEEMRNREAARLRKRPQHQE